VLLPSSGGGKPLEALVQEIADQIAETATLSLASKPAPQAQTDRSAMKD
jgi:hypothetical protein